MSAPSDRELIASAVGGDVGAFATLVGRYRDVYTRFAIRMLGSYEAADEALQAAFVRAFQSLNRRKEQDQFSDWLFRIVINECRGRALRRVVRERRVTGEMPAVSTTPRPLADDAQAMQRVVDQIDPVLREPFLLLYAEELAYVRIAALTGVPVQTLERQVDRACTRLRELVPSSSRETQLSSVGMELLSSEPAPSLAVQVATPLRRPEVLNDSFEDRLMTRLLRAGTSAEGVGATDAAAQAMAAAGAARTPAAAAPLPPSPWTQPNDAVPPLVSRRLYLAAGGIAACLALAAFVTGYAARRWRDVRDVERRRPGKPVVVNKIVRRTDTIRVVRSDTLVLARFVFLDDAAHSVSLAGDFNDWTAATTPLQPGATKGAWATTLSLSPGRYEYAFLVDGKRWVLDRFTRATHDESGVTSSVATFGDREPGMAADASGARSRLKKILPRDVAERVLAKIATAKEQGLPAGVLEQRALELAARRIPSKEIERTVDADQDRLTRARRLLTASDHPSPTAGEMVAGAEALRQGGDSSSVLALARAVPPRRSVAVPLEVVAQLAKGGMNVEEAVDKVRTRVHNDASDAALERWADETVVKFASRAPEKGKGKTAKVAKQGATSDVHQAGSPKSPATRKKAASAAHQTIP